VVLTSAGLLYHLKLATMLVSMVQLQQHGVFQGSWRSKAMCFDVIKQHELKHEIF